MVLLGAHMRIRKVLTFNSILGLTLPKELTNALGLTRDSYVEVFLRDKHTIVVKKHQIRSYRLTTAD